MSLEDPEDRLSEAGLREGVATGRRSAAQPRHAEEDTEFEEMLSKASFLNIRQKKKLAALRSGRAGNATSPAAHGLAKQMKGASVGVVRIAPLGSDHDEWKCRVSSCSNKNYHRLRECSAFLRMAVEIRTELVLREGLCRACLTIGHGTSGKRCIFAGRNNELCKWDAAKQHIMRYYTLTQERGKKRLKNRWTCHPSPWRPR
jgi:hypothetical protein